MVKETDLVLPTRKEDRDPRPYVHMSRAIRRWDELACDGDHDRDIARDEKFREHLDKWVAQSGE